jgi:hypothetical protein
MATAREIRRARFEFALATNDDERELRQALADCAMDGHISLAFAREPNFFAAAAVDGEFAEVIVARDRARGRIAGMGIRSISPRYVNGHVAPVGYLSGLRVLPAYRRQAGLVARGYRYLKERHGDGRTPYYLTTIAADNAPALRSIAAGRADLPRYEPLGDFLTLAVNVSRVPRRGRSEGAVTTRLATEADRPATIRYLNEHGPRRQFFPAYREQDLFTDRGMLQKLRPSDIVLATDAGRIVGVLGAWNQSSFKQVIVQRYSRGLGRRSMRVMGPSAWSRTTATKFINCC